jgi:hypothetical protein
MQQKTRQHLCEHVISETTKCWNTYLCRLNIEKQQNETQISLFNF